MGKSEIHVHGSNIKLVMLEKIICNDISGMKLKQMQN